MKTRDVDESSHQRVAGILPCIGGVSLQGMLGGVLLGMLLVTGGSHPALAQGIGDGLQRIEEQQRNVGKMRETLRGSVTAATELIKDLKEGRVDERFEAIEGIYDRIQADTRAVLDSIALNSDFRDAIDDMRAEIDTLIDRNMMEPESAARETRLQRLQSLREQYRQQYDAISELEGRLNRRLVKLTAEKREAMLDAGVDQVEQVVAALGDVVSNLESLDQELQVVEEATYGDPAVAQ
ncbi:hypothetical protein [Rhodosalinus sediminis]|uniref:hypothetical protein n=1 Tax=Rhodosalinus sediminis TaxID=1940533 RepID=UPI002353F704|nr:hypothetical protein [Rhodosalinus sediminis]